MASIDMVVVNYHTYDLTDRFLSSYRKFKPSTKSYMNLIDNETNLDKLCKLEVSEVEVYPFEENLGYAKACNFGASLGDSEYIGLFNSDTEFVDDKCVDTCVQYMEDNPEVAVVGPLQYSSDGVVTHGGILGTHSKPTHRGWKSRSLDSFRDTLDAVTVSGSAYFTKRSVWDEMKECPIYQECFPDATGAFPPFNHFYEETLYSYHAYGHGYKCVYLGAAEMIHQWHKSSPVGSQTENMRIGQRQFRGFCDSHGLDSF